MKLNRSLVVLGGLVCATVLVLVAASPAKAQGREVKDAPEVWGGMHVSMTKTALGATLEFDCAQGIISEPIKPNAQGQFTASGTYIPERGGPVQKDNPPRELPASYQGFISGDTMRLKITLADQDQGTPPPLTLTRSKPGHLVKCR